MYAGPALEAVVEGDHRDPPREQVQAEETQAHTSILVTSTMLVQLYRYIGRYFLWHTRTRSPPPPSLLSFVSIHSGACASRDTTLTSTRQLPTVGSKQGLKASFL